MHRMVESRRCYIHVGLPKSGTSYLQSVLRQSEEALAAQGLDLLPRTAVGRRFLTVALRGRLNPETDPPAAFRVLRRLRREATEATGDRALISHEVLGALTPDQAGNLLDRLPGYEPHLIITVRDLARSLASGWQQEMQALSPTGLEEFMRESGSYEQPSYNFHRRRVVQSVLTRWGQHVPPERIHIVTVPPRSAGPRVLLERFCEVLEVDPDTLDLEAPRQNTALGVTQAELMRRINIALGDKLSHPRGDYDKHAKRFLAKQVLLQQAGRQTKMPESAREWCLQAAETMIGTLSEGGYRIVGDLDDLRPEPSSFAGPGDEVTDAELVEAAVDAIAALLVDRAERHT